MAIVTGFASLFTLAMGAVLAYLGLVAPLVGLGISTVSLPLALLSLLSAVWRTRRTGSIFSLLSCLFAAPSLVLFMPPVVRRAVVYPRINDVSTDLRDPPAFRERKESFPPDFAGKVREHYGHLTTLRTAHPPAVVYQEVLAVCDEHDSWRTTRKDAPLFEVEGVATSEIFQFPDDFVIRVRKSPQGSLVDMRSRSRETPYDLGSNATRIDAFMQALSRRLAGNEPRNVAKVTEAPDIAL